MNLGLQFLKALRVFFACALLSLFPNLVQAADIDAQLDSQDGSSGFVVQTNSTVEVARVDSKGNLIVHGNVGIGTWTSRALLDVSTGLESPLLLPTVGNSVYIGNDLEVDGTAYLVEAAIGTLTTTTGIVATGGSTFDHIEVTGESVFNTQGGNVGIGTTMTGASANTKLAVVGGNVGIGTTTPQGGFVVTNGNVGIGTWVPQALLDVSTGGGGPLFLAGAASQSVYIQNDLEVDGTAYLAEATIGSLTITSGLTLQGGSTFDHIEITGQAVFNTTGGNVGIGTTMTGASAGTQLAVIGGNVGIGTTTPAGGLVVTNGNVGIGTWVPQALLDVSTGGSPLFLAGAASQSAYIQNDLEVDGTSYLAEATIGSLTITSGLSLSGGSTFDHIEVTGESVFNTAGGNVGIGTTMTGASVNTKLAVVGGNVGIGTTTPAGGLVITNGNVGIGTWVPQALLDVSTGGSPLFLAGAASQSAYIQNDLEVDGTAYLADAVIGSLTITSGLSLSGGSTFDHIEVKGEAVFNTQGGNVGIGTTMTGASAGTQLAVIGGNVGIGTTTPAGGLAVMNGNVGIGTWVPQALLDVSTGGGSPLFLAGAASQSAYIQNDLEVDGTAYLADAVIGSLTITEGLTLQGGSTFDHIEVTGESVFNTQGGNVGIGTTMTGASANTKLAVVGGNVGIGTTIPGGLLTAVGGNVGIGTWNPQALLDVSTGGASPLFLTGSTAPQSAYIQNDLEVDGTTYLADAMVGSLTVSAGITLSGSATFNTIEVTGASVFNTINGNVGIGTTMTGASAGTQLAVIGGNVGIGTTTPAGGLAVMNGNVGIGTWAPQALLDVSTGGASPLFLAGAAPQSAYIQNDLEVDGTSYLADAVIGSLTITEGLTLQGGSTFDHIEVTGEAIFNTQGGNVGIGTTMTGASAGTQLAVIGGNVGIGTTSPAGGLAVMNGNVGIGTWAPQALFDVSTGGASPLFLAGAAPQSAYIQNDLEVDGTSYLADAVIGSLTITSGLTLQGGSTFDHIEVTGEAVFNTQGGNVGIGTTMTGASAGTQLAVIGGNVGIGTTTPQAGLW